VQIDRKLSDCGSSPVCPAAYPTDTATWVMQGKRSADSPARRAELQVPADEVLSLVTPDVIDQIRRQRFMDADQLGTWVLERWEPAGADSFRAEFLDRYVVESDEADFRAYVNGEGGPDQETKAGWLDFLRSHTTPQVRDGASFAARTWRVVHVVDSRALTPYLRFEIEWCYPDNIAAGADVRILDKAEVEVPTWLLDLDDFYIVDGHAVVLAYDRAGEYLHALELEKADRLASARDLLWEAATPFAAWWARHPESRRAT